MSIASTYSFPWASPTFGDWTALIYFDVQGVVFSDFHCSECSVSVFQRPMSSCVLLFPEEEEGMDIQSPQGVIWEPGGGGRWALAEGQEEGQEMSNLHAGCRSFPPLSSLSLRNMNHHGVRQFYSDGSTKMADFFTCQKRPN